MLSIIAFWTIRLNKLNVMIELMNLKYQIETENKLNWIETISNIL